MTDAQLDSLLETMDKCLIKYEARAKKRRSEGKNVGPLDLGNFCTVVNSHLSETYYFHVELEEFKKIFEDVYVKGNAYKLQESGFLDPHNIYPFYKYSKVKQVKNK